MAFLISIDVLPRAVTPFLIVEVCLLHILLVLSESSIFYFFLAYTEILRDA